MSEYEPSGSPEITQAQGDKIISFVLVDMADRLGENSQYTFNVAEYPELHSYQDVTVNVDGNSINFILHYEKDHEEFFDTFSYYPEVHCLDLRKKYTIETLERLYDMQKAMQWRMQELLMTMKARVVGLAKTDSAIKAVWDEYRLIKANIDASRGASGKGQFEIEILKHSKEANKLEFIFLFERAQEIDEQFAELLHEYDTLVRNENIVREQLTTVYDISSPKAGDPQVLLKAIEVLTAAIEGKRQNDQAAE